MSFHFLSSAEWKSRDSASARFGLQAKRAAESIDAGQLLRRAALVISKCAALGAIAAVACCADSTNARTLRVCADPNNLPFSNEAQQGFENRLAEIIAAGLGATLKYTWWAERASFLRNSLNSNRCDAVMGVPATMDTLNVTAPYYRSTYVVVTRHDRRLHIQTLLDPALDDCRIGVHVTGNDYAPPAAVLARRGLSANIVGFSLFGSDGEQNPPRNSLMPFAAAMSMSLSCGALSRDISRAEAIPHSTFIQCPPRVISALLSLMKYRSR